MNSGFPRVYERSGTQRWSAAVVYGIATPVVLLPCAAIAGFAVGYPALRLGLDVTNAWRLGWASAAVTALLVARHLAGDYRRQYVARILVWPDRLELATPGRTAEVLRFAELDHVQYLSSKQPLEARLHLRSTNGRAACIKARDSTPAIAADLADLAASVLAHTLHDRLQRGDTLRFDEPTARGRLYALIGLGLIGAGAYWSIHVARGWWAGGDLDHLEAGPAQILLGCSLVAWSRKVSGGGLLVSSSGLARPRRPNDVTPWTAVVHVAQNPDGVAIDTDRGTLRLSDAATNAIAFPALLRRLLPTHVIEDD